MFPCLSIDCQRDLKRLTESTSSTVHTRSGSYSPCVYRSGFARRAARLSYRRPAQLQGIELVVLDE